MHVVVISSVSRFIHVFMLFLSYEPLGVFDVHTITLVFFKGLSTTIRIVRWPATSHMTIL